MADIFKDTSLRFGGGFKTGMGLLSTSEGLLPGTLMQQIAVQFAQRINQIYEVGDEGQQSAFYFAQGRAGGTLSCGHILAPSVSLAAYYDRFSDVCKAGQNSIQIGLRPKTCGIGPLQLGDGGRKAEHCVLVSISDQVDAQNLLINEGSQLMFGNLIQA